MSLLIRLLPLKVVPHALKDAGVNVVALGMQVYTGNLSMMEILAYPKLTSAAQRYMILPRLMNNEVAKQ